MMDPLDELYLEWLTNQVRDEHHRSRSGKTHRELFERMYNVEFVWTMANDDNRVADGLDLRWEFLHTQPHGLITPEFEAHPCSVLEVLVGISRRLAFNAGGTATDWAWQLIENLGLHGFSDPLGPRQPKKIEKVLHDLIWRQYHPNGLGGFFPLGFSDDDQTKVEIWDQMSRYIDEQDLL